MRAYLAMGGTAAPQQQVSLLRHWQMPDSFAQVACWSVRTRSSATPMYLAYAGRDTGAAYHSATDADFRIDFVTTLSRTGEQTRLIEPLNVVAQPLPFMEFSLEAPIQAAIFDRRGRAVLVNVPPPARYAVHKLIVAEHRGAMHRTKVAKDLAQAISLAAWFAQHDHEGLMEARENALKRGPTWRKALDAGWSRLQRAHPTIMEAFTAGAPKVQGRTSSSPKRR